MIKFTTDYNEKENLKFLVNLFLRRTPIFSRAQTHMVLFDLVLLVLVLMNPDKLRVDLPLLLLLALPWLIQRLATRLNIYEQCRDDYRADGKREYTVDQNGISVHSATLDSHLNWSLIQRSDTAGDFYYLTGQNGVCILCRIHELSEKDFTILQHLVQQNAGREEPQLVAAKGPLGIRFNTDFNSSEIRNFLVKRYMQKPKVLLLRLTAYIGMFALLLWAYSLLISKTVPTWISALLSFVFMVTLFNLHSWFKSFYQKRLQRFLQIDSADYIVTTEGITRFCEDTRKTFFWSQITGKGLEGDIYYLAAENNLYFCCDRKKVSQEDFEALRSLAAAHVKK